MKHLVFASLLLSTTVAVAQVQVSQTATEVTIGNQYMRRSFSIASNQLLPGRIDNFRAHSYFVPTAGQSEEFSVNTLLVKRIDGLLPTTGWTVESDGHTPESGTGLPADAIDGNPTTYWHSNYTTGHTAMPHYLLFDMQTPQTFQSFAYTGRSANQNDNGQMKGWELWAGDDKDNLSKVGEGTLTFSAEEQWVNLSAPTTARFVKLVVTSSQNGRQFAACGEFCLSSARQGESGMTPLPRTGWRADATSWCEEAATVGRPALAIDGDPSTLWHSWYTGQSTGTVGKNTLPYSLIISLGNATTFRSFGYQPRTGLGNGTIKGYEFEISNDSITWTKVKTGELDCTDASVLWTDLGQAYTARYVRLTETSERGGNAFGSCAEFYLSNEEVPTLVTSFAASQMELAEVRPEDITDGKRITFRMKPFAFTNPKTGEVSEWKVSMVVEMKNDDHYLRKYLLIDGDEAARNTPIDYIEMDRLDVASVPEANRWTHPASTGGVGGMSGYTLTLGQPTYIEGLFLGSEFPQAENEISEGAAHTRYFSGKTLNRILGASTGDFRTWSNVVGATRSVTDMNIIRTDFFQYINAIARPIAPRLQYNSWYDWMMRIDESRINSSFMEMERGFSQFGIRPLDSYVVDDGWNSYSVSDTERSGTTPNQSGFWEFNSKFPTGLDGASDIAHKLSSDFGIWLGPRGGYNFNASWGQLLERSGNGTYNRNSADAVTGDSVYIAKLGKFFLDCQRDYGVNYWKLDGFSTVQPQASTNNRYITGGKNGNYYFTEHWERWYKTFEDMYAEADGRGAKLWLNLTCYVNPSPWILQWCNSVWMQNSLDMGRTTVGSRSRELDKQLSYRDDRYYDFYNTNELQFPLANIFNHDPIYGKEEAFASNAMTASEFRAYLYMMATRGTAFWEMLYSYTMMNETGKWMVNAEAINFIEKNFETLRHSIYHGDTPKAGNVYGFSSWNKSATKTEGIISFRNPSSATKTYSLTLDNRIGVPEDASGLWRSLVMEYSGQSAEKASDIETGDDNSSAFAYGQTLTLSLKPGEIRIWKFSTEKDVQPATVYTATASAAKSVTLQLDEPVIATKDNFVIRRADGTSSPIAVSGATRQVDYRTYALTAAEALEPNVKYVVEVANAKDWNGNVTTTTSPEFFLNEGGTVLRIDSLADLASTHGVTEAGDFRTGTLLASSQSVNAKSDKAALGKGAFGVSFGIKTSNANGTILSSGTDYRVTLNNGKIVFTVGSLSVTSTLAVNDAARHHVTCVRETNGLLKIYIDGTLNASAYDGTILPLQTAQFALGGDGIAVGAVEVRQDAQVYSTIATTATDYKGEHFLITVTRPENLSVVFTNCDGVKTEGQTLIARALSGKNVVVKGTPTGGEQLGTYIVDGTTRTASATATMINVPFSRIAADHTIDFSTVTGLSALISESTAPSATIYDLSGRPVRSAQRGVYVVNGKKVVK